MDVSNISCVMIDESNFGLNAFVPNQMTTESGLILYFFKAALCQLIKVVLSQRLYLTGGTRDDLRQSLDYFHSDNMLYFNMH